MGISWMGGFLYSTCGVGRTVSRRGFGDGESFHLAAAWDYRSVGWHVGDPAVAM